jgi:FkbM family methyltransferase
VAEPLQGPGPATELPGDYGLLVPAKQQLRRALRTVGLEPRAVVLKRAFEAAHTTQDRRDHEALATIFAATLAPDACCIDIGAHSGDVLAEIVRIAPRGHHFGFEPLPALAAALRQRLPGVEVRNVALGDTPGTAPFVHVLDRPGWSGLKARPTPDGEAARTETLAVTVQRLDDALPTDYAPALIKIDVEGAELGALEGARATLTAHHPLIVFEHGLGSADHYGTSPDDVHDLLTGLDYRIFDLQGDGPYHRAAFAHAFHTAARVNFMARP